MTPKSCVPSAIRIESPQMYPAPIYKTSTIVVSLQSTLDAISAALQSHAKNTIALTGPCAVPLSKLNHANMRAAFHTSRSFDFEPIEAGVADNGKELVGAYVTGFATVTDAMLQCQLTALGLTCSIWYEVSGDMAETGDGAAKAIRLVEDTISVSFEVFEK